MNATIVVALIGSVSGVGALVIGVLNLVAGRGGRRASEASELTKTGMDLLHQVEKKCDDCEEDLRQVRIDFSAFVDVVEELVPLLPEGESQRKARVAITAARMSHLSHAAKPRPEAKT